MRNKKKGFTLIELLIVVVIVGILALAAIPLIASNTRDARRAEGEQQLGTLKNRVKVAYARVNGIPPTLTGEINGTTGGCGADANDLLGKYFNASNTIGGAGATSSTATLTVSPSATGNSSDGTGTGTFNMLQPSADTIVWAVGTTGT
jgi:prepilin-type N-terminal cleavage/methylation domain-containing protein